MNNAGILYRRSSIDSLAVGIYFLLLAIGCLLVYSAGYQEADPKSIFDLSTHAGRQVLWSGIAILLFLVLQIVEDSFWRTFAYPAFAFSLLLLLLVLLFGSTIKGQTAWFSFGGFSFQPSEIAKFGTCLALASHLSSYNTSFKDLRSSSLAFGIVFLPIFFILLQPDAGSAIVFSSLLIVLYRAGFSANFFAFLLITSALLLMGLVFSFSALSIIVLLLCSFGLAFGFNRVLIPLFSVVLLSGGVYFAYALDYYKMSLLVSVGLLIVLVISLLWKGQTRLIFFLLPAVSWAYLVSLGSNYIFNNFLMAHQQERINVWLHPEKCDPRGSLYNVLQSKLAIGSGGFVGKGFLEGNMTKLNYVPEQNTDFIFCTVGEEYGFLGVSFLIGIYVVMLFRLVAMAERQRLNFKKYYIYGVVGILFTHFFINIGMTIGIMPVIGIPLPLISYGGSSLIGFTLLIGTAIKLDSDKSAF
jgi:rod shape determining protein RodA